MAIIKVLNAAGKYNDPNARRDVINYIFTPYKTPNHLIGGLIVDWCNPPRYMEFIANQFQKNTGVRLRHFILSFDNSEKLSHQNIMEIANLICDYIGRKYQVVFAVHEDTNHLHIHFVHNTISYIGGYRYRGSHEEHNTLKWVIKNILYQYNIYSLTEVKYHPNSYNPYE